MITMKNIFIAVAGSTPQILTESLYDFIINQNLNIHEIIIVTTSFGKGRFDEELFNNGQGHFYQFCRDYELNATELPYCFRVIKDGNGQDLYDIRNETENKAAANFIADVIKEYTNKADVKIIGSIAGGRKTMSAYMNTAMQLFARQQDELYHVLISPADLENSPVFFYPRPNENEVIIKIKDKPDKIIKYKDIQITNASIDFIRLRERLPFIALSTEYDLAEMVALTQEEINNATFSPKLTINLEKQEVVISDSKQDYTVDLQPEQMAFYYYLLKNQEIINDDQHNDNHAKQLVSIYELRYVKMKVSTSSFQRLDLQQLRSKVNKKIKDKIKNKIFLDFILIQTDKNKTSPKYSVTLKKNRIKFIPAS